MGTAILALGATAVVVYATRHTPRAQDADFVDPHTVWLMSNQNGHAWNR